MAGATSFLSTVASALGVSSNGILVDAYSALIRILTGESPIVSQGRDQYGDFTLISFTPKQQQVLRDWVEKQLDAAPGPVRLDVQSIAAPILLKRALPYLAGGGLAGFAAMKLLKRR